MGHFDPKLFSRTPSTTLCFSLSVTQLSVFFLSKKKIISLKTLPGSPFHQLIFFPHQAFTDSIAHLSANMSPSSTTTMARW